VNVDFDVYRIRTQITEQGSRVEAGLWVDKRARDTRSIRWEQLDEDLTYQAEQLDRHVVTPDQIRTVVQAFRDRLFTEIFPGRKDVPKTLIYAKDDSHADDIVQISSFRRRPAAPGRLASQQSGAVRLATVAFRTL